MSDRPTASPAFDALVTAAADRYRSRGVTAREFARAKLRSDPVYRALITDGLLPARGHLLDLGCGQGLLPALVVAARAAAARGAWPDDWGVPPRDLTITGVELRPRIARIACAALAGEARVLQGDAHDVPLAPADAIVMCDVLQLVDREKQLSLLSRATRLLAPRGRLLIREADASGGWRFRAVVAGNYASKIVRGAWRARHSYRSASEWRHLLERLGLAVSLRPMGDYTPFANVLLVGEHRA